MTGILGVALIVPSGLYLLLTAMIMVLDLEGEERTRLMIGLLFFLLGLTLCFV